MPSYDAEIRRAGEPQRHSISACGGDESGAEYADAEQRDRHRLRNRNRPDRERVALVMVRVVNGADVKKASPSGSRREFNVVGIVMFAPPFVVTLSVSLPPSPPRSSRPNRKATLPLMARGENEMFSVSPSNEL